MQFQVPQFIEVEDKIFGPLTFRQFIYLAGGAGFCFIFYAILPFYIAIFPIAISASLAICLSFVKYNGRSFINIVEAVFKYSIAKKIYLWRREQISQQKKEPAETAKKETTPIVMPKLSESKLKELAWSLDVKENINTDKNQ